MSRPGHRRYRWDREAGRMVEVGGDESPSLKGLNVTDAYFNNPVQSPVDGRVLGSRADLREHNRELGCVDVGNDESVRRPPPRPDRSGEGLDRDIKEAYAQLYGA